MARTAQLFVVSGPSGVGKGTLVAEVRKRLSHVGLTVSATTRAPRPGEVEGSSYYFMNDEQFGLRIDAGEFLEWAWVHGHRYGTLKAEVERLIARDESVILEIDVQGGINVRQVYPDAVLIFVDAPSASVLEKRLRGRATEDEASVKLRLADARRELELAKDYDVRIVNDNLDRATDEMARVIQMYETEGGPSKDVCH